MTQTQLEYYNGLYIAQLTEERQQQLQKALQVAKLTPVEIDNIIDNSRIGDIEGLNVYKVLGMV